MELPYLILSFLAYLGWLLIFLTVAIIKGTKPTSWILYDIGAFGQFLILLGNQYNYASHGNPEAMTVTWILYVVLLILSSLAITLRIHHKPEQNRSAAQIANSKIQFQNIKERLTDILGAGGSIVFFVISYIFLVMPLLVLHLHFLIDILLIFLIATIPLLGFFIELILWICSLVSLIHNPFDATILNIVYFLALAIYIWGKGIPGLISVFLGFFSRKKNQ